MATLLSLIVLSLVLAELTQSRRDTKRTMIFPLESDYVNLDEFWLQIIKTYILSVTSSGP